MAEIYDSNDLLLQFQQMAGRNPSGDSVTPTLLLTRLARAQRKVVTRIAGVFPRCLYPVVGYGSIPTMTTTDSQLFTFGTDANGDPASVIGKVGIYPSLAAIPNYPWIDGVDYTSLGARGIRLTNDRTYGSPLYYVGIVVPPDISATSQPSLYPLESRRLIVVQAVLDFAGEAGRNPTLMAIAQQEWNTLWPERCLVWKTQFRNGGALANSLTGSQIAALGAY